MALRGLPEMNAQRNTRVLIVDDLTDIHIDFEEILAPTANESLAAELAAAFLEEKQEEPPLIDFELRHAMSGEKAIEAVRRACAEGEPFAIAFVDIRMPPGMDGVEAVRRIRRIDREVEIVLMTAYTDQRLSDIVRDMESLHKLLYIRKPFAREELQQIAVALVAKWNLERDLNASHRRLEAVLDATGDAIAMVDEAGQLVFANRWYEELRELGDPAAESSPRDASRHLGPRLISLDADAHGPDLSGEEGELVEHRATDAGRRLFVRTEKTVRNARGGRIGDLVVLRDVSREIEIQRMRDEVLRLRAELDGQRSQDGLIGAGAEMAQVRALMRRAAEGGIPVLIMGESGTGKELVARWLHNNGPCSDGPFVAVNCAAVPPALIESELFGHERGAFTGAHARHIGSFERAHGGTVFLDEVGDMDPALQARLLRVLQSGEIERVGGAGVIPLDFELISATHKDLDAAMRSGEFREDLYYRIAAFPIALPPLRDRSNDIPELADHFLDIAAQRAGKRFEGFSEEALAALLQYDWPGNVRELENIVHRAVLLETDGRVRARSLKLESPQRAGTGLEPGGEIEPLADTERRAIRRALEHFDNNISRAAAALGVARSTLHRKLRDFRN